MEIHTTNYFNTLIVVAEDIKVVCGVIPSSKTSKTIAEMQYERIIDNPYKYTSDEMLFQIYAIRNDINESDINHEKEKFFSKGQACLRTSPLARTYGFGIHFNEVGKVAIYGVETFEYNQLLNDENIKKVKAMRTKRIK